MIKKIRKTMSKFLTSLSLKLWILLLDRRNKINVDKLSEKKVLIADCEKIGNYIFKTPLIRGLKSEGFHITVMGSPVTRDLLAADHYIDDLIITKCYRKKSSDIFRKTAVALRYRKKFSHYIETTGSVYLRELLFMRLLSPTAIIGGERKRGITLAMINLSVPRKNHNIDISVDILESMGIKGERRYHVSKGASVKYDFLHTAKPLVLYNGKASVCERSVSPADEIEIIRVLEENPHISFKKIQREASLTDLVALVEKSDFVITVDTGISHIASALNKPILIDSYSSSCAPVTSHHIRRALTPKNISSVLDDFLLDTGYSAA